MALPHAASGEVITLHSDGEDFSQFSSIALARTEGLELIKMIMPKGKSMPEHHVSAEVTLLCLQGEIEVDVHGAVKVLHAGQMLYLSGGQAHALTAVQDSLALLTILL